MTQHGSDLASAQVFPKHEHFKFIETNGSLALSL